MPADARRLKIDETAFSVACLVAPLDVVHYSGAFDMTLGWRGVRGDLDYDCRAILQIRAAHCVENPSGIDETIVFGHFNALLVACARVTPAGRVITAVLDLSNEGKVLSSTNSADVPRTDEECAMFANALIAPLMYTACGALTALQGFDPVTEYRIRKYCQTHAPHIRIILPLIGELHIGHYLLEYRTAPDESISFRIGTTKYSIITTLLY